MPDSDKKIFYLKKSSVFILDFMVKFIGKYCSISIGKPQVGVHKKGEKTVMNKS